MNAITIAELSKTYSAGLIRKRRIEALLNFTLDVRQGEIFGLLGPNGAGKTTLVKALLSIVRPSSGTASIMGKQIQDPEARQICGYLPENHRYPEFLNAVDTLRFFGGLHGVDSSTAQRKADQLLDRVGLQQWKKIKTRKFSKGMLQRLGLAQALISDPQILFLDEPTDGVDPVGRKEIRDLLFELRNEGKTIFLNSHLLSEVELLCDRVGIMKSGKLVRLGTIDEFTQKTLTYTVQLATIPDQTLLDKLHPVVAGVTASHDILRVELSDSKQLNAVLDLLRSEHIELLSVNQVRESLEDFFVKTISGK